MTRAEAERQAERILKRGKVTFRHAWKSGRKEKTVEVFELRGKFACRKADEVSGPFRSLTEALYESEFMDELHKAGKLVAINVCMGTGSMIGDGETRIFKAMGLYFITDDWGHLDNYGPFESLEDAIGRCDMFHVSSCTERVRCTEMTEAQIVRRLEGFEGEEPFSLSINGEDWTWDGRQLRRGLPGDAEGEDGK